MRTIDVDNGDILHLSFNGEHAQLEIIEGADDYLIFTLGEYQYAVGFKVLCMPREINFEWMGIKVMATAHMGKRKHGDGQLCFDADYLLEYRYDAQKFRR
jgi:hypothetical protein